jgi:hypothetical protein
MTATSSLVSFVSFEQGLAEDPFVLDPNIALWSCLQRNLVRAVRRAILVFVFTRSFLVLIGEIGVWSLHLPLMYFQLMSLFVENFVLLSTSSAFQIFLFRPNYTSIEEAAFDTENILWETMNCRRHQEETSTIEDLFMIEKRNPKELLQHKQQTNTMRNVELYEQKIYFLKQRMNHAIEKLSKVSGVDLSSESSDLLDDTFKFTNVHLICKFNRHVRKNLFTSFWTCFFEASTGVIDSFSLSLGVLNSISTRRHRIEEKKAIEMEKSLPKLLHFLMDQVSKYPLLLLDQNPHLSHLTIPSDAFESKLQYFFDSKVQFAARFFVMEETKRRIFLRLQLVKASLVAIGELVSISRKEDQQGNVQVSTVT